MNTVAQQHADAIALKFYQALVHFGVCKGYTEADEIVRGLRELIKAEARVVAGVVVKE